jgi:hypothetical protein
MPEATPKKNSWRAEREFGVIVGGVLVLLSVWWQYRGKFSGVSDITLSIGSVLLLFAGLFPRALYWPNKAWMALAEVLSFVTTRIVLGFVFFVIITPIGFIKRLFGWDPLHRRAPRGDTYWRPYSERQKDPRHYEKMF